MCIMTWQTGNKARGPPWSYFESSYCIIAGIVLDNAEQKKFKNFPYAEIEWWYFLQSLFTCKNGLLNRSLQLINFVLDQIL